MTIINNINAQRFSFNGVEYYKNFTPVVVGNKIRILNAYDSAIELTSFPTLFSDFEVDGNTFLNVADLQSALLPILFTRATLSGGGGGGVESVSGSMVDNTDPVNPVINSDSTKLDKVTTVDEDKAYIKLADGTQAMKPISEIGGGSTKEIRTFYGSWPLTTQNAWISPSLATNANKLVGTVFGSYGTGTEPNKVGTWFADNTTFFLKGYSKLKKVSFYARSHSTNSQIQLLIWVGDYSNLRGNELNGQYLVNELYSVGAGSNNKTDFTISTHSLNDESVLIFFFRRIGTTSSTIIHPQLIFEFE
jgi:hypothetical protein